jgi:hypothetical protein
MEPERPRAVACTGLVRLLNQSQNADKGSWLWRMMDRNVPIFSSLWLGTGTVHVELSFRRCMIT